MAKKKGLFDSVFLFVLEGYLLGVSEFTLLRLAVSTVLMAVLKWEKLRIVAKNLIPFIIFAGMQLALEFFVVYSGAWGGNTFVATFRSVELLILFFSLL